ncbi:hypothetical protein AKJ09_05479 [Labilithrix luteola]|uniref:Uncharacterized protein n=1 Tax=Labilithrix luteola TaxID=1391654 RepID=A0A0K1PZ59_9BACT|nr:hypothetical protein [Labilithrix luteola]AKU98815.1 hypothetical protein AKJ09_05479 [Labilithrix luteola]
MITMHLTSEDAQFLREQLASHTAHVEDELQHTGKQGAKKTLAGDLEHLQNLITQLSGAIEGLVVEPDDPAAEQRPAADS